MPDDFTTLAANAAAMNAEEAFDRCLSELQANSASDAKLSWILRVADMSKEDTRAEYRALCQAHLYRMHQTPEPVAVMRNRAGNAISQLANDLAVIARYPEHNKDPYAIRSPRKEWNLS